jgi:CxxC motif-containing protein
MMTKDLICIVCPNGCKLVVSRDGDTVGVVGNKCAKGEQFAITELTNPARTISSTVKTTFAQAPVLPVKVSAPIPKSRIFNVMDEINKVTLSNPVRCGDVVISNVLGLGVDIIATSSLIFQMD